MKSEDKNQLLNTLEATVNNHLQQGLLLQNKHTEILLKPSATGGWSIAQCLEHLNRYGYYYLPAMQVQITKIKTQFAGATFTSTWLGRYFINMMNPQTGKKKYKAFKEYLPPATLDAHAVVAEFINQQETLLTLIEQSRKADLNKVKIPVSIARFIRLRLGDVFQFVIAHNERHLQQATRNLSEA